LESKSHVLGAKVYRRKLEKISRKYELQVRELVTLNSVKTGMTDLNSTERKLVFSDLTSYVFLVGSVGCAERNSDRGNTHEFVK